MRIWLARFCSVVRGPVAADSLGKIIIHRLYNDHMMMTLPSDDAGSVAALPQSAHELITVH